jgi:hypothetical protein
VSLGDRFSRPWCLLAGAASEGRAEARELAELLTTGEFSSDLTLSQEVLLVALEDTTGVVTEVSVPPARQG